MAKRRTYRSASKKRYTKPKRKSYSKRRRSTPRNQRITIVLQQAPQGMLPAGLTLGKKNYTPVRATL